MILHFVESSISQIETRGNSTVKKWEFAQNESTILWKNCVAFKQLFVFSSFEQFIFCSFELLKNCEIKYKGHWVKQELIEKNFIVSKLHQSWIYRKTETFDRKLCNFGLNNVLPKQNKVCKTLSNKILQTASNFLNIHFQWFTETDCYLQNTWGFDIIQKLKKRTWRMLHLLRVREILLVLLINGLWLPILNTKGLSPQQNLFRVS